MSSFDFPVLRPIRIPTKGKPWWKKICIALFTRRKWEFVEDYYFYVPWLQTVVKIPAGFITDGASIPLLVQKLLFLKPLGILLIPALLHDFGYVYDCWIDLNHHLIPKAKGRKFFDWQFRKIGRWVNEIDAVDWVAWLGLAIGGWLPWEKRRKENRQVFTDFPVPE